MSVTDADLGDLDVDLAWPVTDPAEPADGQQPALEAAPEAGPVAGVPLLPAMSAQLREVCARLEAVESAVARLTELVELVIDIMPGSAEGTG
jgi:hypothetical protein